MSGKLTKAQRRDLAFILAEGPGTLPETKAGRTRASVSALLDRGLLETLNKLRPGNPMYEITPAGLAALNEEKKP
jgi:hypothetical protein